MMASGDAATATTTPAGATGMDRDAETRAHFTARAATYSGQGDASVRAILELAAPQPGERVLDVATGTGLVLFALAEATGPDGLAAGVDFTPAMLAQALTRRGEAKGRTALLAAHAARLPFRPSTFDAVTCRFSIHHFSDPAGSIAAMGAALRPGGRLVIADFVLPDDPVAAERYDRLERLRGHPYVEIYTQARLEQLMGAAGCPVTAVRYTRRENRPVEWLNSANVAPENRAPLERLIAELAEHGGAGLEVREEDSVRTFVRQDAVLLGIRQ